MAEELLRHGVAAVAVTPGFMRTEAMLDHFGVTEANWRDGGKKDPNFLASETPFFVGRAIAALAADARVLEKSGGLLPLMGTRARIRFYRHRWIPAGSGLADRFREAVQDVIEDWIALDDGARPGAEDPPAGRPTTAGATEERTMTRKPRKIIVYIATSADGYIARADGSVDFLDRPRTAGDYGMGAFFRSIDTILLGRKTYDQSLGMAGSGGGFDPKIKELRLHAWPASPARAVEFVNEPIGAFAKRIRAEPGKDIWMMGGGGLIGSFLDAARSTRLSSTWSRPSSVKAFR